MNAPSSSSPLSILFSQSALDIRYSHPAGRMNASMSSSPTLAPFHTSFKPSPLSRFPIHPTLPPSFVPLLPHKPSRPAKLPGLRTSARPHRPRCVSPPRLSVKGH
ncbi:hypothetical protein FA13DRAFT_161042 [Coprinellus micaceus]|uniref:Uncharacterized protein n=1 Tax=Coprinellus micaceus TaxID=71717 RepID=A0A4Y7THA0_COPMI|nr:hypothetical protein FA13DRAFT_161042 [Coprinellus micaceus]